MYCIPFFSHVTVKLQFELCYYFHIFQSQLRHVNWFHAPAFHWVLPGPALPECWPQFIQAPNAQLRCFDCFAYLLFVSIFKLSLPHFTSVKFFPQVLFILFSFAFFAFFVLLSIIQSMFYRSTPSPLDHLPHLSLWRKSRCWLSTLPTMPTLRKHHEAPNSHKYNNTEEHSQHAYNPSLVTRMINPPWQLWVSMGNHELFGGYSYRNDIVS